MRNSTATSRDGAGPGRGAWRSGRRPRSASATSSGVRGVGHRRARRAAGHAARRRGSAVPASSVLAACDDLGAGAVVADQLDRGGAGVLRREVAQVGRRWRRRRSRSSGPGRRPRRARRGRRATGRAAPTGSGETSWNSSTTNHLYCRRTWAATRSSSASMPAVQQQDVLHVHPALAALDLLVAAEDPGHGVGVVAGDRAAAGGGDPGVVVGADVADLGPLDLGGQVAQQRLVGAEPLPAGGGGRAGRAWTRSGSAARCRGRAARSSAAGAAPRSGTCAPAPRPRRACAAGARISPAARVVKVTASTSVGA